MLSNAHDTLTCRGLATVVMRWLRFLLTAGASLLAIPGSVSAQLSPAVVDMQNLPVSVISDINVAYQDETLSILLRLSAQPSAASVTADGRDLRLEIDGLSLKPLILAPPAGSLLRNVSADGGSVTLSGAILTDAEVVIYRRALLVTARLSQAEFIRLTNANSSMPALASPAAAPQPEVKPHDPAERSSLAPAAPTSDDISEARCAEAEAELVVDNWSLSAMGDFALCLVRQGRNEEAKARLDQLEAIMPSDRRIAVGRDALAVRTRRSQPADGIPVTAAAGASIVQAVRDGVEPGRAAASDSIAGTPDTDLQLPLPR